MSWDKEKEAQKILAKEKEIHMLWHKYRDGRRPTSYQKIGYCKESTMHSDWYQWAVNSYNLELAGYLFHIPNEGDTGGQAGAIKGGIRLAMGVLSGAPDFGCPVVAGDFRLLEVKLPGETLSKSQVNLHEKWASFGFAVELAFEFLQWRAWIEDIVKTKRASDGL